MSQPSVQILFVDDGSNDGTFLVLEKLQTEFSGQVEVLRLTKNVGKAEAVRTGINRALASRAFDAVGFWDADLATPLESVVSFSEILLARSDIEMVFGSRVQLCGRHIARQPSRHYLGRIFATAVSIMLQMAIYDTQCGAKLFRVRPESASIFATPFLSKWIFDVEILARLLLFKSPKLLESQIYEYPLERWTDIAGSKVKPTDFLKASLEVITIWRRYLQPAKRTNLE